MSAPSRGIFVAFEGIEGSGKSTQCALLSEWLRREGHQVVAVREPGGTLLGEAMRDLLLRTDGPEPTPWAELCTYMAARAQLVSEVVAPALAGGRIVVADRFGEASVAYQGGGRQLGEERVSKLYRWVTRDLVPRRVYLLDLAAEAGLERVAARGAGRLDRLESEPLSFHQRVRESYLRQAEREPRRFRVLDATLAVEHLQGEVRRDLSSLLEQSPADGGR